MFFGHGEMARPADDEGDSHQPFVKATAFEKKAVVSEHFAVIAGEDDDGVIALPGFFKRVQETADIVVDQLDHGVVGGDHVLGVEFLGRTGLVLEVSGDEFLCGDIAVSEGRRRDFGRIVSIAVLLRGIEGRVGVEDVDAHQPRAFAAFLGEELDGAVCTPGGLVQLGRDRCGFFAEIAQGVSLCGQPVGVGVAGGKAVFRVVAPVEDSVAVIFRARFFAAVCAGEVEFAAEATVVAAFCEQSCYERCAFTPLFVAVHAAADVARVAAGEEAGPARRADGALAEGAGEGNAFFDEPVQVGRVDVGIAEGVNCVEPLLVGTEPENIGTFLWHRRASFSRYVLTL